MNIPSELKYMSSHEWIRVEGDVATVGITDFAQDQLGDVVYVELPEVGREVKAGETIAVVESVKTASDIYSPASGEVVEVNEALSGSPEKINEGPYEDGWLYKIRVTDLGATLSADEYAKLAQ